MWTPFVGVEAIEAGALTPGALRWNYVAIHPGVYVLKDEPLNLVTRTVAAWLWTDRRGVITGRAAAALHGARWVDAATPIDVIAAHTRPRLGVVVHEERIAADEIVRIDEMAVTSIARTALDLGRHLPRGMAVSHLDALAAATGVSMDEVTALFGRYRGSRGVRRAREAVALMDGGAQSPRETWLRLLLIDAGLPAPRTQIRVADGDREAFIDMGYDVPMVGLDYEGAHHSSEQAVRPRHRARGTPRSPGMDRPTRRVRAQSRVHPASAPRGMCASRLDAAHFCASVVIRQHPRRSRRTRGSQLYKTRPCV